MALKAVVASLDEVPEAFRSLYVSKNGKFYLDAEGVEDVTGLKSALDTERSSKKAIEKELKAIKDALGDNDAGKAAEAMKRLAALEAAAELGEIPETLRPKVEKLFESRTEALKGSHTNELKSRDKKIAELIDALGTTKGSLKRVTIDSALKTIAIDKKIRKDLVDAVVLQMTVGGVDGITWDLDANGKIVAMKDGQVKHGKDAVNPMSFEEGFELLQTKHPSYFEPSTGSGATNTGKPGSGFSISAADARDPQKYQAASEAAGKAGQQLQIVGA